MPRHQFPKGNPGKPPGTKNRITRKIVEVLEATLSTGDIEADLNALRAGTVKERAIYWGLVGRMVPHKLEGDAGPILVQILHGAGWDKQPVDPGDLQVASTPEPSA